MRSDGLVPLRGHTAVSFGCINVTAGFASPALVMAFEPEGFEWAAPKVGNVFIPLQGEATLDRDFRATAVLDEGVMLEAESLAVPPEVTPSVTYDERSHDVPPRVAVSADDAHHARVVHRALGRGDVFEWGAYHATVARVMEPSDDNAMPIGWVEISLATAL